MDRFLTFQEFVASQSAELSALEFVINLGIAAILSLLVGWFYVRFGTTLSNRRLFARNFILLTLITTLVITIVKSSLALSLGLVGWKEQMMLQATVPVEDFGFSQSVEFQTGKAIQWLAEDTQGRRILLPAGASSECVIWDRGRSLMFAHGRDWMLIDGAAINPGCITDGQTRPAL